MKPLEKPARSLVKTVTYRLLIIISTFVVTYLITRRIDLTVGITLSSNLANTLLYYIHERIWNKIRWGRG